MTLSQVKSVFYKKIKKISRRFVVVMSVSVFVVNVARCEGKSSQDSFWKKAWGQPTPSALYVGMVTAHSNPDSLRDDNWNNQLIGANYKGNFAATLLNSFGDRAYIAGIQRYVFTQEISTHLQQSVGYRLGFISGYDERMASLAKVSPLLPVPQLIYDVNGEHFGIDVSVTGIVISFGLFYQF